MALDYLARAELPLRELPGYDGHYGLELLALSHEEARAQVPVRPELLQPAGLVHGGVLASIAEGITSMATWVAVQGDEGRLCALVRMTIAVRDAA